MPIEASMTFVVMLAAQPWLRPALEKG